jgi:hemerythrin
MTSRLAIPEALCNTNQKMLNTNVSRETLYQNELKRIENLNENITQWRSEHIQKTDKKIKSKCNENRFGNTNEN